MARPWKHPKTGIYWFRKAVPAHLRKVIGKWEIRRSLGTRDPHEARRRYPDVAARVDAMLMAARYDRPARLTHRQLLGLVGDWYRAELATREEDPTEEGIHLDRDTLIAALEPTDEERAPTILGKAQQALMIPDKAAEAARIEAFMRPHVDRLLIDRGLFIDDESRSKLGRLMFKHAVLLNAKIATRLQGDYSPDPVSQRLPTYTPPVTTTATAGPTFDELVEGWARETAPTETVRKQFARYLGLLRDHIGHDDASRVEPRDIVSFKDARLQDGMAPKTVATNIQGIGAVFGWAVKNLKIASNPAKGIEVAALKSAKRRGERSRYPYTAEEAARILRAARGEAAVDRRWLPWLCALTGARISEVASLTGRDVRQEDGVWFIEIGNGRRVKSASSIRRVPLHPALIAEGFLTYAEAKGARERLFPVNSDQNVARWVRERVGITDQSKAPSHAWRHWFEDEGRAAGITEEIRDALAGHANATIGRQYGYGYSAYRDPRLMQRLAEAVAKIALPQEVTATFAPKAS